MSSHAPPKPLKGAVLLPRTSIRPNPDQPRTTFAESEMQELAASIALHGVLQPLLVRLKPSRYDGTPYQIIGGERRWRASEGILDELPAIIKNVDDAEADELALIDNLQRVDLTPLEEAHAVRSLIEKYGLTINQVARRIAKTRNTSISEGWINNRIALLKTGEDAQELAASAPERMSHALLIDRVKEPELRRELLEDARNGASYQSLATQIEEAGHKAALQRASERAPDAHTQERAAAFERGDLSSVSRGQRVKGPTRAESRQAVLRAQTELLTWGAKLNDDDWRELVEEFARRILRGDLKR